MRLRVCAAVVVGLVAALLAGPIRADAATGLQPLPWSTPGPRFGGAARLSCVSTTMCVSVGTVERLGIAPVAAVFDGQRWDYEGVAAPSGRSGASLSGVSCPSIDWCAAVGALEDSAADITTSWVAVRANGIWTSSVLPRPTGATADLESISCAAAGDCVAVGSSLDRNQASHPLIEHLSADTWTIDEIAGGGPAGLILRAVSCPTTTACTAVGETSGRPTAARLRNGAWTTASIPAPPDRSSGFFTGIDCVVAAACTAIGSYFAGRSFHPAAATLSNAQWSIANLPEPGSDPGGLTGTISCTQPGSCVAVQSGTSAPHVETLAGGTWSAALLPVPPGASGGATRGGVSCVAAKRCQAVWASRAYADTGIAESLSSSGWSAKPLPTPDAPQAAVTGLSCRTLADCVGVGTTRTATNTSVGLAETLQPNGWRDQPIPDEVQLQNVYGVDCPASGVCTAVAREYDGGPNSLVAFNLSGGSWTRQSLPPPPGNATVFVASRPSCPAAGWCVVVVSYWDISGNLQPVALTLTDGAWSAAPLPPPFSGGQPEMSDVSCPQVGSCVAIGHSGSWLFAETLSNGTWTSTWINVPGVDSLPSVSCVAPARCTAVGTGGTGGGSSNPVVATLDDGGWHAQSLPAVPRSTNDRLNAVSCTGSSSCTAVGDYLLGQSRHSVVASWNGSAWSVGALPNPRTAQGSQLSAVSCVTGGGCWAAGSYVGNDGALYPAAVRLS